MHTHILKDNQTNWNRAITASHKRLSDRIYLGVLLMFIIKFLIIALRHRTKKKTKKLCNRLQNYMNESVSNTNENRLSIEPSQSQTMKVLKIIGLVSLVHAGYSSYEFTHSQKSHNTTLPLPQDIILEVFISLLILSLDLLLSPTSTKLSLINNDVIKPEYKLKPILMKDAVVEDEKLGAGPFQFVESRVFFTDFDGKRKKYAEWVAKNKKVGSDEDKQENKNIETTGIEEKAEEREENSSKEEVKEELKSESESLKQNEVELETQTLENPQKNTGKKNGKKSRKS